MKVTVRMEGMAEARAALQEIAKAATEKKTVKDGMKMALVPMRDMARELAPKGETLELSQSIVIGDRLTGRQNRLNNKSGERSDVEVYMGVEPDAPYGVPQEFGTVKMEANPFMRPAWDAHKRQTLGTFARYMAIAIEKTRARVAKAAERRAARIKQGK